MVLTRKQVEELFARDIDKYAQKKEEGLAQLRNFDPFSTGLGALAKTGVGAVTGYMTGGLGGAVMGGIQGAGAKDPIQAGIGGLSAGSGLSNITNVTPQMNIPGGVSGEVANTVGKTQDLGQLFKPDNMLKTSTYLEGIANGDITGATNKLGVMDKEAKDKQIARDEKIEEARIKREQELADLKTKHEQAKELEAIKKANKKTTTTKTDPKVQRKNFVSATNKLDEAFATYKTAMSKKYGKNDKVPKKSDFTDPIKKRANELYAKGELTSSDYNAILKRIKDGI